MPTVLPPDIRIRTLRFDVSLPGGDRRLLETRVLPLLRRAVIERLEEAMADLECDGIEIPRLELDLGAFDLETLERLPDGFARVVSDGLGPFRSRKTPVTDTPPDAPAGKPDVMGELEALFRSGRTPSPPVRQAWPGYLREIRALLLRLSGDRALPWHLARGLERRPLSDIPPLLHPELGPFVSDFVITTTNHHDRLRALAPISGNATHFEERLWAFSIAILLRRDLVGANRKTYLESVLSRLAAADGIPVSRLAFSLQAVFGESRSPEVREISRLLAEFLERDSAIKMEGAGPDPLESILRTVFLSGKTGSALPALERAWEGGKPRIRGFLLAHAGDGRLAGHAAAILSRAHLSDLVEWLDPELGPFVSRVLRKTMENRSRIREQAPISGNATRFERQLWTFSIAFLLRRDLSGENRATYLQGLVHRMAAAEGVTASRLARALHAVFSTALDPEMLDIARLLGPLGKKDAHETPFSGALAASPAKGLSPKAPCRQWDALGPEGEFASRFFETFSRVHPVFRKHALCVPEMGTAERQLRAVATGLLWDRRTTRFNRKRFVFHLISRLASSWNMETGALLEALSTAWDGQDQETRELLSELWLEHQKSRMEVASPMETRLEALLCGRQKGDPVALARTFRTRRNLRFFDWVRGFRQRPDLIRAMATAHSASTLQALLVLLLESVFSCDKDALSAGLRKRFAAGLPSPEMVVAFFQSKEVGTAPEAPCSQSASPSTWWVAALDADPEELRRRLLDPDTEIESSTLAQGASDLAIRRLLALVGGCPGSEWNDLVDGLMLAIGTAGPTSPLASWRDAVWGWLLCACTDGKDRSAETVFRELVGWMAAHGGGPALQDLLSGVSMHLDRGAGFLQKMVTAIHAPLSGPSGACVVDGVQETPTPLPEVAAERCVVDNAGVVIVSAYLPVLFDRLGYLERGRFRSSLHGDRAVHLVRHLSHAESARGLDPVCRLLCGTLSNGRYTETLFLTEDEIATGTDLLAGIIGNWPALKTTTVDGLREGFLARDGILELRADGAWHLDVASRGWDVLLDRLPWGLTPIRHPWMASLLHVHWRDG